MEHWNTESKSSFDKYNRGGVPRSGMVFALSQTSQICHEGWNYTARHNLLVCWGDSSCVFYCTVQHYTPDGIQLYCLREVKDQHKIKTWKMTCDSNNFFIPWSLRLRNMIMKIRIRTLLSISCLTNQDLTYFCGHNHQILWFLKL